MKIAPIVPAEVVFDADGTPTAPAFGDVYHARGGALEQAQAVFLAGNGLPERWAGRDRFVILETGFGLGQNFLATWQAWRNGPHPAPRLWFVSIEKHPVPKAVAQRALAPHQGTALQDLAQALVDAWPETSPDVFRAEFDEGRVVLQVVHADVGQALRELRLQADALFLDGFSPRRNEAMWSPHVFKALPRLLAPGCTAATWSAARVVRQGLQQAGFDVDIRPGFAGKRHRLQARWTRDRAKPGPHANRPWIEGDRPVLIIGAGLAGAACARALARSGVPSTVLDAAAEPAQGASGNPAGLFHGVLHPEDGAHARLGRAAAWTAQRTYAPWIQAGLRNGQVHGQVQGLLRREDDLEPAAMQALIDELGLPAEFVQALDAPQLTQALQVPGCTMQAAWFYPGGGWIDPRAWVRHALSHPGIEFRGSQAVAEIRRDGEHWQALDAEGRVLAQSRQMVLCQAAGVAKMLKPWGSADWPVGQQRGQITRVPRSLLNATPPARPVSGGGYALTLPDGDLLCGATASREDFEPLLRLRDHQENLDRLRRLLQWNLQADWHTHPAVLGGRVGWRFQTIDRLPIVGPVGAPTETGTPADSGDRPDAAAPAARTRLREWPGEPGLFVATALGSRGITWAPLVGAVIAAWLTGEPAPLPGRLMDALDPRRFALKRARRQGSKS